MEEILQDEVYYSLANFGADALELFSHLFEVFQVHDIKRDLITDAFSCYPLRSTYGYVVFFDFLCPKWKVLCVVAKVL